jgi:hypothetical protein
MNRQYIPAIPGSASEHHVSLIAPGYSIYKLTLQRLFFAFFERRVVGYYIVITPDLRKLGRKARVRGRIHCGRMRGGAPKPYYGTSTFARDGGNQTVPR